MVRDEWLRRLMWTLALLGHGRLLPVVVYK